jgi:hypothetical protein
MTLSSRLSPIAVPVLLSFACSVFAVGAGSANDPMEQARRVGLLVAHRGSFYERGTGLLLLDLRPTAEGWPAGSDYVIELSPSTGGTTQRFPIKAGQASLITLEAGRYCLGAVEREGKRYESKCEPPFYDVSANSVDISGQLDITLRFKRLQVRARTIDASYVDAPLSETQQAELAAYLDAARDRGRRTFFVSAPPGLRMTIRLLPNGIAAIEEYSLANATYTVGTWSEDGTAVDARFQQGNSVYHFEPAHGHWRGILTSTTNVGGIGFRATRRLAVSPLPTCWHWLRCGTRWPSGIISNPDYTFVPHASSLKGKIELEFALKVEGGVLKPDQVDATSSELSRAHTTAVEKNFSYTLFAADVATPGRRYRQGIEFVVENEELFARTSELTPVPTTR